MKKNKWLALVLSVLLLAQSVIMPMAMEEEPTETEQPVATQPEDLPFGTVCIQKGCRTINGMAPLAGTEKKLESALSAFLFEVNSNTVVYAYNPDMKVHPGTLAKIVLALLVVENCGMDDLVTVTEGIQSYVPAGASTIKPGLKSNEVLKVRDLLYALLLINANDAAVALAHHVAGTSAACVEMMNKRVKQMGCTNTEFGNVSGLYTAVSNSSARDMTRIVQEAIKNKDFCEVFGAKKYTIPDTNMVQGRSEFKTINYLIDDSTIQDFWDTRVTGGFASYHESYGASVVCTAESNGMKYIAVILGATRVTDAEKNWVVKVYGNFNEMTDLLDYAFNGFKINRIIYEGMALSSFKVNGGECNVVGQANVNVDTIVPANAQMKNIQMNYKAVGGGLSAPIKKDQMIATLEVVYRNSVLTELEVFAMSDVKAADKTGVKIRSLETEESKGTPGFLSALGTICVIVLGVAIAYLAFNAYMRNRIRARRRKRRSERRRNS